jgi:hypothetical protein
MPLVLASAKTLEKGEICCWRWWALSRDIHKAAFS